MQRLVDFLETLAGMPHGRQKPGELRRLLHEAVGMAKQLMAEHGGAVKPPTGPPVAQPAGPQPGRPFQRPGVPPKRDEED